MEQETKMKNNLKSIAIIGEGETEWFYFESLRTTKRYPFKVVPGFPQHADISHFLKLIENYIKEDYDYILCLLDMDRLNMVPAEMKIYQAAKRNYANKKKVIFVETNPCTEFWFLLHFLPQLAKKQYTSCEELLSELRQYMPGYEKTKRYFRKINLFKYLTENGNLDRAMTNAEKLCQLCNNSIENQLAYSEIHKVFTLLNTLDKSIIKNL